MFLCMNFFVTSLLLLLLFTFPVTLQQQQLLISPSSSPAPAPAPAPGGPSVPVLPQKDVDAFNSLLRMSKYSISFAEIAFKNTDCDSKEFGYSVQCNCSFENSRVCRVTQIDLSNQELSGYIPRSVGDLEYLTSLDLTSNRLRGSIPDSFVNLTQLTELYLGDNKLDGPIPDFLGNMTSLQTLGQVSLSFRNMTGKLSHVYLRTNFFSESIPPQLGNLLALQYLSLRENFISGSIPIDLGNMSGLIGLHLDDNDLSGELPPHLGNLSYLQSLYLMNNRFTGELPSSLRKLKQLQILNVQGNSFGGTIPDFIDSWQDLNTLMLMGNNFEGPLPTAISSLKNLTYLAINDLAGGARNSSFPDLSGARSLGTLTLRNCGLVGGIPEFIWQLPALTYLDLSFNSLSEGIPAVAESSRNFMQVFLRRNKLNGSLPGWMLNMSGSFVDVSENFFMNTTIFNGTARLNSTLPSAANSKIYVPGSSRRCTCAKKPRINLFGCCSRITDMDDKWQEADYYCANRTLSYDHLYINCGGNATIINGTDYKADQYPDGGSTFFLSDDKAWGYSSMGVFLETTNSQFVFNKTCLPMVDAPLYISARVAPISLKYYGFCLKNDKYIVKLHFAEIGWNEPRANFSTVSRGRVFNVEIQGERRLTDFNIEAEAGGLGKDITREYNVSINNTRLEIHLYWSGKGSVLSPTKYYGPLISAISVSPVPKPRRRKFSPPAIAAMVGGPLLFVALILALCWKLGWIGKKSSDGVELFPGGVFNYQQIKAATNNFAPENKIGEGGFGAVYKGVLPPKGTEIAVKQLSTKSKQGAREFITEIGIIYALRHPNLVKLLGCCNEKNQLLLVYEYMENNSLEQALFVPKAGPEEAKSVIPWETRVKICLDVAKGLAYLHHECKLNIIHGDIKSTNILLDKEFNAKISDFGYARTSEGETSNVNAQPKEGETTRTTIRIQGTPGYMAPECMKAMFTPKVDVYSFGIVILEIVSGKKCSTPRSKGPTEYLLEKAHKCWKDRNLIALVDSRLPKYNHNEALKLLNLAMLCVSHDPMYRPTMNEVVKILEGKKKFETVLVPVPVVDSTISESETGFSDSIPSGSTSLEITSETTTSYSVSKEIDQPGTSPN